MDITLTLIPKKRSILVVIQYGKYVVLVELPP